SPGLYDITPDWLTPHNPDNPTNYKVTFIAGKLTVNKATPAFSNLTSPITIAPGQTPTSVKGKINGVAACPEPTPNVQVSVASAGSNAAPILVDGSFSTNFATGSLLPGSYAITYAYAGDANYNAAANGVGTLVVQEVFVQTGSMTTNRSFHTA